MAGDADKPLLRGANDYLDWAVTVESALRAEGLWNVVANGAPTFAGAASTSSATVSVPLRDTFTERDSRAIGYIRQRLSHRLVTKYKSFPSSKGLWDALKDAYAAANNADLAFALLKSLHTITLPAPSDSDTVTFTVMEKHIERIGTTFDKLHTLGYPVDDTLQPLYLLGTLPDRPTFVTLRTSITSAVQTGKKLTLDEVEVKFLAFAKADEPESEPEPEVAHNARGAPGRSKSSVPTPSSSVSAGRWCDIHGTDTHWTKDCGLVKQAKRKVDKRKKGKAKEDGANTAADSDVEPSSNVASVSQSSHSRVSAYIARDPSAAAKSVLIDSGASCTMSCDTRLFETSSFRKLDTPRRVRLGDNSACDATHIGTLRLSCKTSSGPTDLSIGNALFVPSFAVTLISVHQLASKRLSSHFIADGCTVRNDRTKKVVLTASHRHGLYHVNCQPLGADETALFAADINHVHRVLGHTNFESIRDMVRHGRLDGVTSLTGVPEFCEACVLGKMKKKPFGHSRTVPRGPLDIVSSDVGGPVTPEGAGKIRYWITIVDHYSSHVWVLFAYKKSQVYTRLKEWRETTEAHFRSQIANWEFCSGWTRFFRTDGGGEYTSHQMEAEFKRQGIIHETTAPYTPEQDGVAERMNQTLTTRATTNLVASHIARKYWPRAMSHAAYTINRSPASAQKGQTPHERLYDRPVNLRDMHPFGCPAYPLVTKPRRDGKFAEKATRTVFIGYHEGSKAYDLLDIDSGAITTSRHVKFHDEAPAPEKVREPGESAKTTADLEKIAQSIRQRSNPYYQDDDDTPPPDVFFEDDEGDGSSTRPTSPVGGTQALPKTMGSVGESVVPGIKVERPSLIPRPSQPSTPFASPAPRTAPLPKTEPAPTQKAPRSSLPAPGSSSAQRAPKLVAPRRVSGQRIPPIAPAPTRHSERERKPAVPKGAAYEKAAAAPQHLTKDAIAVDRERKRVELQVQAQERKDARELRLDGLRIREAERDLQRAEEAEGQDPVDGPPPGVERLHIVNDEDGTYLTLDDADLEYFAGIVKDRADPNTPNSWQEAMDGPDRDKWIEGINDEIASLIANNVFEVVPIPDGVTPITSTPFSRSKP